MDWTEIKITVNADDVDRAGDIAHMAVPYGIYIEDYRTLEEEAWEIAIIDLIDEDLLAKDRSKGIVHIYISPEENPAEAVSFLSERLAAEKIEYSIDETECKNADWENNWKKYFKPMPVGERLLIHPIWEEEYDAGDRAVIHLEPGLAFGSGTHDTTRLCLESIEKYAENGKTMLDVGCGSGVLGIAALLMGAESAVGVDIDELAVKTAIENAEINGVSDRFEAICGSFTDKVSGKYELVLANIVADAIMFLSKGVRDFMKDDAVYIMSGIIDTRAEEVKASVSQYFDIIEEHQEKGWVCFAAKQR